MSYDPTEGTWMEADPAQYINGLNCYQMESGNPSTFVDPSGLYRALPLPPAPPLPSTATPLPLPDPTGPVPNDPVSDTFYEKFLNHAAWSSSSTDTYQISQFLHLLPPKTCPRCNKQHQYTLQQAVDDFTNRALQHEQAVANWFGETAEEKSLNPSLWQAEKEQYFAVGAGWETAETLDMYKLLRKAWNLYIQCVGNGPLGRDVLGKLNNKIAGLENTLASLKNSTEYRK